MAISHDHIFMVMKALSLDDAIIMVTIVDTCQCGNVG
jgi:hypothetical protein